MDNIQDVARQAARVAQAEIAGPSMIDERNRYAVVDAVAAAVLRELLAAWDATPAHQEGQFWLQMRDALAAFTPAEPPQQEKSK